MAAAVHERQNVMRRLTVLRRYAVPPRCLTLRTSLRHPGAGAAARLDKDISFLVIIDYR